jgi:hypothetical protein
LLPQRCHVRVFSKQLIGVAIDGESVNVPLYFGEFEVFKDLSITLDSAAASVGVSSPDACPSPFGIVRRVPSGLGALRKFAATLEEIKGVRRSVAPRTGIDAATGTAKV